MDELDTKKLDQIFRQQVHQCQELMKPGKTPDELILKSLRTSRAAVSLLQQFAGSDENANKSVHLKLAVHNYTQSILDSTYFQECTLTGAEFSDKTSFEQIAAINQALSLPAQLCSSVGQVAELLGTDLLECLYWRVGALLYMFCHSMYEREEGKRKEIDRDVFLKCCCAGVGHLRLMLSARTPLAEDDDYISHDTDMIQLLQQGIFSDIHMLSLMYAGELCYWAWLVSSNNSPSTDQGENKKATKMSRENDRTLKLNKRTKSASVAVLVEGKPVETTSGEVGDKQSVAAGRPAGMNDTKLAEIEMFDEPSRVGFFPGENCADGDGACEVRSVCMSTSTSNEVGSASGGCVGDESGDCVGGASGSGMGDAYGGGVGDEFGNGVGDKSGEDGASGGDVGGASGRTVGGRGMDSASGGCVAGGGEGVGREDVSLYHVMLHTQGLSLVDAWKSDFNSLRHGVEMLSKYISVARGPLKDHGWNYSKAVELMVKLRKATMQRD